MFLDERIDVDELRQQVPAFFYKRFDLSTAINGYFLIPIDWGFAYLLRSIRTKWQAVNEGNGFSKLRQILIEFTQNTSARNLQDIQYPVRLISTPAESGVTAYAAPMPVDNDGFGVNFTATPVKNNLLLNYVYQHRETLDARIQFDVRDSGSNYDMVVDLLFIGYYLPERSLDEWQ